MQLQTSSLGKRCIDFFHTNLWKKYLILCVLSLFVALDTGYAQSDKENCKEHTIIPSRIPDYYIGNCDVNEFSSHTVFTKKGEKIIEGKKTVLEYFIKEGGKSVSEVFVRKNYMEAIKKQGAKIEYESAGRGVGVIKQADGTMVWVDVAGYIGIGSPEQTGQYIVTIVEIASMEQVITATSLGDDLQQTGRSVLYIQFESGKSTIKPESMKMIEQMALYLNANKSKNVFIVGHTDNAGTIDMNMKLSEERAVAVVNALVGQYNVSPKQVIAKGIGPLAPIASNNSEDGKKLNRRVEMVLQ